MTKGESLFEEELIQAAGVLSSQGNAVGGHTYCQRLLCQHQET